MKRAALGLAVAALLGLSQAQAQAQEAPASGAQAGEDCVILLHGLARTEASMRVMEEALAARGYRVVNQGYPSREASIEDLAGEALPKALAACGETGRVHFVTHSMGSILLRHWASEHEIPRAGRAVMLGPPGGGSEIVDTFGDWALFGLMNGPAGRQLGTGPEGMPARLPRAMALETGVIAGTASLNPALSILIDGRDDGKVSVASALTTPAKAQLVLPVSHTFMMRNPRVVAETITFLEQGRFSIG